MATKSGVKHIDCHSIVYEVEDALFDEAIASMPPIDFERFDRIWSIRNEVLGLMRDAFDNTSAKILISTVSSFEYLFVEGKETRKKPSTETEFEEYFRDWEGQYEFELGHEILRQAWEVYQDDANFSELVEASKEVLMEVATNVTLLLGAVSSYGHEGAFLNANEMNLEPLMDMTPLELRKLLPCEVTKSLTKIASEVVNKRKPKATSGTKGEPLRHAGKTVHHPRTNNPAEENGRKCDIACEADRFTIVRGKGKRSQDREVYMVPPSVRPLVDALLSDYERGVWTTPPDGTPKKWQSHFKGTNGDSIRKIIRSESNGKNGYTGRIRLWIE